MKTESIAMEVHAETETSVVLLLRMNKKEAEALKAMMQNPVIGDMFTEDKVMKEIREKIFNRLTDCQIGTV